MRIAWPFLLAGLAGCAGGEPQRRGRIIREPGRGAPWAPPPDRLRGPVESPEEETKTDSGAVRCIGGEERPGGKCPKCGMDLEPAKKEHDHR